MGTEMRGAAIGLLYRKILATRSDGFAAAGQGIFWLGLDFDRFSRTSQLDAAPTRS